MSTRKRPVSKEDLGSAAKCVADTLNEWGLSCVVVIATGPHADPNGPLWQDAQASHTVVVQADGKVAGIGLLSIIADSIDETIKEHSDT